MKLVVSIFAVLAVFAGVGQAAPLETKNVAADAKWVVHVDVDAVRDSLIVKKAFETCPMLKDSGKHFDMIRDKAGVDLRKDLHGITVYGPDTDRTHAVAIVFSTVNEKLLLDKAQHATDHKVTKHGEIEIHSWTQKRGEKTHAAAGAFYKADVLVFAASVRRGGRGHRRAGRQVARHYRSEIAAGRPLSHGRDGRDPGERHSAAVAMPHPQADRVVANRHGGEQRQVVLSCQAGHEVARGCQPGDGHHRRPQSNRRLELLRGCRSHETRRRTEDRDRRQDRPGPLGGFG